MAYVSEAEQTIWFMMEALGYDTDGDKNPAALIAGMGRIGFYKQAVTFANEVREQYDEALNEVTELAHDPNRPPMPVEVTVENPVSSNASYDPAQQMPSPFDHNLHTYEAGKKDW